MDRLVTTLESLSSPELSGFKSFLKKKGNGHDLRFQWLSLFLENKNQDQLKETLLAEGKTKNAYYQLRKSVLDELESFLMLTQSKTKENAKLIWQINLVEWYNNKGLHDIAVHKLVDVEGHIRTTNFFEMEAWVNELKREIVFRAPAQFSCLNFEGAGFHVIKNPEQLMQDIANNGPLGSYIQTLSCWFIGFEQENSIFQLSRFLGFLKDACFLSRYTPFPAEEVRKVDHFARRHFPEFLDDYSNTALEIGLNLIELRLNSGCIIGIEGDIKKMQYRLQTAENTPVYFRQWLKLLKVLFELKSGNYKAAQKGILVWGEKQTTQAFMSLQCRFLYLKTTVHFALNELELALETGRELLNLDEELPLVLGKKAILDFQLFLRGIALQSQGGTSLILDSEEFATEIWQGAGARILGIACTKWMKNPSWKSTQLVLVFRQVWRAAFGPYDTGLFEMWLGATLGQEPFCFGVENWGVEDLSVGGGSKPEKGLVLQE
jgi:hypothetical protein